MQLAQYAERGGCSDPIVLEQLRSNVIAIRFAALQMIARRTLIRRAP